MKISELINTLQTILDTDGDVEVKLKAYDGGINPWPVERVSEVRNAKIIGNGMRMLKTGIKSPAIHSL